MYKNCKFCNKEFNADVRELNRGNALYCSLSCVAKNRNKIQPLKKCKCVTCNNAFTSKNTKAKYCCAKCRSAHYRHLISTEKGGTRLFQKILLSLPCANCNWNISSKDVHHIIPVCNGGKNDLENLITLCPNCHRLAHRNLLSEDKLKELVHFRTISSSI